MSTLIGILIAFGRLSTDNEITAMRAHGVSFQQLLVPMLITSAFLSVTDLVFMDYALPHGNAAYSSLKRDISRKNPTFVLEEGMVMKEMESKGKIWMFEPAVLT
jgi:lipopolysaccharide export LptBFGC system permease protein LptF